MQVIPVIDLKAGHVVHARLGHRAFYRPIETPLATGSGPIDVVTGLLSLHPFATLYVADLDAIGGKGEPAQLASSPTSPVHAMISDRFIFVSSVSEYRLQPDPS